MMSGIVLRIGLNPYGLTYYLGLQGRGTPRENPRGRGLEGFLEIAVELGARTLEIHNAWLAEKTGEQLQALGERLMSLGMEPVISLGPPLESVETALRTAAGVGAKVIRLGLTPVLSGARAECAAWPELVGHARATLREFAPRAEALGIALAIEDHQDLGSQELLNFCEEAGHGTGICLDTGNSLAVGEAPIEFTRRVAPLVRHVHLKDYNAQWTDDGYRLVRCAIGDGAVPFAEIAGILREHHASLTASLEPGALEARHIRLFRPEWWQGYAPRSAAELGPCLTAARRARLAEDADWRTPWEKQEDSEALIRYELEMIRRSAENMRRIGLMAGERRCPEN
jgi:sugar phosphate isomerase/epimerase